MEQNIQKIVEAAQESIAAAERCGIRETEPINKLAEKLGRLAGFYPAPNFAVEVCCKAFLEATRQSREEKRSHTDIARIGKVAYCNVLPRLSDHDGISDFIACVVHGMAVEAIPSSEGTRLLYGAQLAFSVLPAPKRHKMRTKNTQNSTNNPPATPTPSIT